MPVIKLPGLIDGHVHLREPGHTLKENFKTGTQAAIAGGITTLIDMPNNPQPTVTARQLKKKIRLAEQKALCQVFFHFGAHQDNFAEFRKVKNWVKGLKIYMDNTTGPLLIEGLRELEDYFRLWPKEKPILVHAEDATILKVIGLATIWNKRVHFCHVSQASEIRIIKEAKKKGLPITCEVSPHHLFLSEQDLKSLGAFAMMRPPLRSKKDVQALWKNLAFIDCFATDHAPHTQKEKNSQPPPNGVPGLETALPLLLTAVKQGRLTLDDIVLRFFENPAKIFEIKTSPDTYIEVDLNKKWQIKNENLFTKCGWSPFNGYKVQGKVSRVFVKGKKVFEKDKILIKKGSWQTKLSPDLSVDFCGKKLKNPLILASGVLGTEAELLAKVAKAGAGAVTTKSCCLKPRQGHENPTVLAWKYGVLNAVGLTNPGVEEEIKEIKKLKKILKDSETLIIASFFGGTFKEFIKVAQEISKARPDFLEMNISCPNTESDLGRPFAVSPRDTYKVTKAVKKVTGIPVIVKLSPNVTDIKEIAKAAEEAGADAISAINTLVGMLIDIESEKPILTNKIGGVSGPAIKPVALRCVYQIAQVCKIPLIGLGGINSGKDAMEMIMAGAQAVSLGSAVYYRDIEVFSKINQEIKELMIKHQYRSLAEFRGIAHED